MNQIGYRPPLTMSESETDFGLPRKKSQGREGVLVFYVIFCFPYNYNVLVHCPSCWEMELLCAMLVVMGVVVWHASSGAQFALRISQHTITMYNLQCPSPNYNVNYYNVLVHCPSCWEIEWLWALPVVVQSLLFGLAPNREGEMIVLRHLHCI